MSNIHNNIQNNNTISKFLYNLININLYKQENAIIKTNSIDINSKNINYNKRNLKSKLNSNLNELQRIILDNMSIIHDSLNPNLYFGKKLRRNRYNSFPKANSTLTEFIIPNMENIYDQISKYNDTGQLFIPENLDIIKIKEYKLWYGHNSNIFTNKDIIKTGKILYKNKINSNKNNQLKLRINNIFRIDPNRSFRKKTIQKINNNLGSDTFISNNKIINSSKIRSKSPKNILKKIPNNIKENNNGKTTFSSYYVDDITNLFKVNEINISLFRKNSA